MDDRDLLVRGGLLVVLGIVLVVVFDGVYPLPHLGTLLSAVGAVALLLVVVSKTLD